MKRDGGGREKGEKERGGNGRVERGGNGRVERGGDKGWEGRERKGRKVGTGRGSPF